MNNPSFSQFLVRNLGWIAVSLALSMTIWIAATMESNPIEQREIKDLPVREELADGFTITDGPTATTVTAVVRTDRDEWASLATDEIQIVADLTEFRTSDTVRVELVADVPDSLHARVVAIRPSTLTYRIDRVAEKKLPIQVVVTNDPPLGYTYPSVLNCTTPEVVVRGSTQRVESITRVEARLNLGNNINPVTKRVNLIAIQEDGLGAARDIELQPASVECFVDIQARDDVFQMPVLPRVKQNSSPPSGYDFKGYSLVNPDTVGVTGNRRAIQNMGGTVRTEPIDLTGRTESFTVEVAPDLPDGVSLVPENVLITVQVIIEPQLSTRQYEDIPVDVTGLDTTQFSVSGLAETATVFISAPPNQLPDREQVRVVVNLEGLAPGNHQVEPQGVVAEYDDTSLLVISVQPDQLNLTIEALNPTATPPPTQSAAPDPPSNGDDR